MATVCCRYQIGTMAERDLLIRRSCVKTYNLLIMRRLLLILLPLLVWSCSSSKSTARLNDSYVDDIYYYPFDDASVQTSDMPYFNKNVKEIIFVSDSTDIPEAL